MRETLLSSSISWFRATEGKHLAQVIIDNPHPHSSFMNVSEKLILHFLRNSPLHTDRNPHLKVMDSFGHSEELGIIYLICISDTAGS